MKNSFRIYVVICSLLFVSKVFSQGHTASSFLSRALKTNKVIVLGTTKDLSEDKFEFLFENYSIDQIFKANYSGFSITNLLVPGKILTKGTKEIAISSNNGNQKISIAIDPELNDTSSDDKIIEKTMKKLPFFLDNNQKYLLVLEKKLIIPIKSKKYKKTFFHYPILENKAAFIITNNSSSEEPSLSVEELNEFISIADSYKQKKLNLESKLKYKTVFSLNLINQLLF